MTSIETTAFAELDKEGRLLNAVYKGPTGKPGYCAFRGDFALEFQVSLADEKRPPLYSFEGVSGRRQGRRADHRSLRRLPAQHGQYRNLREDRRPAALAHRHLFPVRQQYRFPGEIHDADRRRDLTILPCDESTVWKEMTDMCGFDKNDFKKLDGGGKVQLVLDKAAELKETYEPITMEDAIATHGAGQEPQR